MLSNRQQQCFLNRVKKNQNGWVKIYQPKVLRSTLGKISRGLLRLICSASARFWVVRDRPNAEVRARLPHSYPGCLTIRVFTALSVSFLSRRSAAKD